ncbi:type II secretion system protein GspJ [Ascidiaceihabitans sp.]|uniref:type II secretion system protein GspJ n=1 Tax=Ascidiaceihabitans sp. TaxID=1872644 RepID=UPI0032967C26
MRYRRDQGLSLMELVVAMAVFALVAVMGLQSLTGLLRSRDQLVRTGDAASELGAGLAMLRHDMDAVVPMLFFPPERATPLSALTTDATRFAMSLAGQPGFSDTGTASSTQRSQWQLDKATGTLHRQVWSVLNPASTSALTPQVAVLQDVTDLRFRSYWSGLGWRDGWANPNGSFAPPLADGDQTGGAPEVYSDTLPRAIEITVNTKHYGAIRLVEMLQ